MFIDLMYQCWVACYCWSQAGIDYLFSLSEWITLLLLFLCATTMVLGFYGLAVFLFCFAFMSIAMSTNES